MRSKPPFDLIQVANHAGGPSRGTYEATIVLGELGTARNACAILNVTFVVTFTNTHSVVFGKYCIRQSKIDIRTCYSLVLDRNSFDSSESSKFDL